MPLREFVGFITRRPPALAAGTAVFLTANPEVVPSQLLHNLKHNKVLHERIVVLTSVTEEIPPVSEEDRLQATPLDGVFTRSPCITASWSSRTCHERCATATRAALPSS